MSSDNQRKLTYSLAINEALFQMMKEDKSVFLMGQGTKSPWYVGDTCKGLLQRFGKERVIDTPVSENSMTGCAVGAAISGMRPIIVHPRMDFMLYAFDPIINEAANWHYMFGGELPVPVVIWGIINRKGEQAAQHSQSLHSIFSHIPGLKVVMPGTPYDAKGLMISAIKDNNPVVFIDDRSLYNDADFVPENVYEVPIGKGIVRKEGKDLTIVSVSSMVKEAVKAGEELEKQGVSAEVIDIRTVKPLDKDLIFNSVRKTGRLLVVDPGWKSFGIAAEISASVSEKLLKYMKAGIVRICLPDVPAPASRTLENAYYINKDNIIKAAKELTK